MILVLLGPPGVGKGTQGERLAASLKVPKIATGDVLRAAVLQGTPLGIKAKAAMDRGDLVPDEVILGIMQDALSAPEAERGAILDGVVRTVPQAEGLAQVTSNLGRPVDAVLLLEASEEELLRRLGGRTVCELCQTPFKGREAGELCEKCGGRLVRRKDDEPEAIRHRLAVFQAQTAPVVAWYRASQTPIIPIDAVGAPDDIEARMLAALAQVRR